MAVDESQIENDDGRWVTRSRGLGWASPSEEGTGRTRIGPSVEPLPVSSQGIGLMSDRGAGLLKKKITRKLTS